MVPSGYFQSAKFDARHLPTKLFKSQKIIRVLVFIETFLKVITRTRKDFVQKNLKKEKTKWRK